MKMAGFKSGLPVYLRENTVACYKKDEQYAIRLEAATTSAAAVMDNRYQNV